MLAYVVSLIKTASDRLSTALYFLVFLFDCLMRGRIATELDASMKRFARLPLPHRPYPCMLRTRFARCSFRLHEKIEALDSLQLIVQAQILTLTVINIQYRPHSSF